MEKERAKNIVEESGNIEIDGDTLTAKVSVNNINDKKTIFKMGVLFANGVKFELLEADNLTFEDIPKSFPKMAYVWSKLCDNNFPSKDYSNVKTDLDKLIENAKRAGLRARKIDNNPMDKKLFLICPVRNATDEQKRWIEDFVQEKYDAGYTIHAPHLHTRQVDMLGGYAICRQNAEAIASSQEVDIFYDQSSTGSVFDLGVAYALHKPLVLLNKDEIEFNPDDYIDNVVESWPYNVKEKVKIIGK